MAKALSYILPRFCTRRNSIVTSELEPLFTALHFFYSFKHALFTATIYSSLVNNTHQWLKRCVLIQVPSTDYKVISWISVSTRLLIYLWVIFIFTWFTKYILWIEKTRSALWLVIQIANAFVTIFMKWEKRIKKQKEKN